MEHTIPCVPCVNSVLRGFRHYPRSNPLLIFSLHLWFERRRDGAQAHSAYPSRYESCAPGASAGPPDAYRRGLQSSLHHIRAWLYQSISSSLFVRADNNPAQDSTHLLHQCSRNMRFCRSNFCAQLPGHYFKSPALKLPVHGLSIVILRLILRVASSAFFCLVFLHFLRYYCSWRSLLVLSQLLFLGPFFSLLLEKVSFLLQKPCPLLLFSEAFILFTTVLQLSYLQFNSSFFRAVFISPLRGKNYRAGLLWYYRLHKFANTFFRGSSF